MPVSSREVIQRLEAAGWRLARVTGSHHHFKHPRRAGLVTVAHPPRDVKIGTLRSIERQSGVELRTSEMPIRHYPAIIEGDAASGYSVFFPDVPGCTSGGETLQEAALNAEEALSGHFALMLGDGERLPDPSRLDDLPRPLEPDIVEVSRLLVRVDVRERAPA